MSKLIKQRIAQLAVIVFCANSIWYFSSRSAMSLSKQRNKSDLKGEYLGHDDTKNELFHELLNEVSEVEAGGGFACECRDNNAVSKY